MAQALLEVRNLVKVFKSGMMGREIVAVDRVSFNIEEGEILSLLGESGSGKTTIARMILRLLKPTSGDILYKGRNIWKLKGRELIEYYRQVQGVFQDPYSSFNPIHKVDRPLLQALKNLQGIEGSEALKIIRETLRKVGLNPDEVLGKYPHQLSGGQLQRVSIARALLVNPKLLVVDEPVSMLDASTRIDVLNIFADLRDNEGVSILMIGHDISLSYYISDRIIILYKGSIMEEGETDAVLGSPLHPYTKMLIESIPRIEEKWGRKSRIRLDVDQKPTAMSGCKFLDRCPHAFNMCTRKPNLIRKDNRKIACWLYKNNYNQDIA
ncbi:MAG: ABC transporter ATP-binding protein [Desulfurococcales archaeon]|nr:ABC transporter ATP-binding protein [Desulfurococcales archaeon]